MQIIDSYTDKYRTYWLVDKIEQSDLIRFGDVYTTLHNTSGFCQGLETCEECIYNSTECDNIRTLVSNPKFNEYYPNLSTTHSELYV